MQDGASLYKSQAHGKKPPWICHCAPSFGWTRPGSPTSVAVERPKLRIRHGRHASLHRAFEDPSQEGSCKSFIRALVRVFIRLLRRSGLRLGRTSAVLSCVERWVADLALGGRVVPVWRETQTRVTALAPDQHTLLSL